MTPKEVKKIIADNPNTALYARIVGKLAGHFPISKTRAIRCARHFKAVQYGTYLEQRPDLNPAKISNGDEQIVTFSTEGA
jgi:hypothetical protein